jgi:hypothetical protein
VRDYAAALYATDDAKWERIEKLQSIAYFILQLFGVRDYGNAILVNKLQIAYLRSINHPCLAAVQDDISLVVEERGEQSLSALSQKMLKHHERASIDALDKAYKVTAAHRALSHEVMAELGVAAKDRTHLVVSSQRKEEVQKAKSFLHTLRTDLRNDELRCFIAARPGRRRADHSTSTSSDGEQEEESDASDEGAQPTEADDTFVSNARINKSAVLRDAEPTVWLTEEHAQEVDLTGQLARLAGKFSPGGRPHPRYWGILHDNIRAFA